MSYIYPRQEKLKSRIIINRLFTKSSVLVNYPLRLLSCSVEGLDSSIQVGVTVSKRNFKEAVDRNRIKRQLRESYRLNQSILKSKLTSPQAFMIMYVGKEKLKTQDIQYKMRELFEKWQPK